MDKLEYVARSLSNGAKKVYETYVINAIYQKIDNPNLKIETQKEIKLSNGYCPLIDLYFPQLLIAVEVDEGQHASDDHKKHDIWREKAINEQISNACKCDNIEFERVQVYDTTLEKVNKRIDEIVNKIKEKINGRTTALIWKNHNEEIEEIKARGTIKANDCFSNNAEIVNIVYGKSLKGWMKASYRLLWFPVISDKRDDGKLSSRGTWQNFFDKNGNIIYERSEDKNKNEEKMKWAIIDKKTTRIVFVKDRDTFGKTQKRFAGVFRAAGWDDNRQAQIWELKATEIEIPLDESIFIK